MKKYALNNSYFKNRRPSDPGTILEIVKFFKESNELPFRYDGENWLYDTVCERQKRKGVIFDQHLTPDKTAQRITELVLQYSPQKGLILDACCGTGQLTAPLLANGFTVEGFDADTEMVEICSIMFPKGRFYRMDFDLPEIGV